MHVIARCCHCSCDEIMDVDRGGKHIFESKRAGQMVMHLVDF